MASFTTKDGVPVTPLEYAEFDGQLELQCRACRKKAKYAVGRVFINPHVMRRALNKEIPYEEAVFFSGYFRCKKCGLGGPWDIPKSTQTRLTLLQVMTVDNNSPLAIHLGECRLFDGTPCHSAGDGEAYLRRLIDADPANAFLWSRLGNLFDIAEEPDRALPAFQKAVELNPHDIESHHSLAEIYRARGQLDEAAAHYHEVLLHARHAPPHTQEKSELLKNVVRRTLECLLELHERSGKRIEFLPVPAPDHRHDRAPKDPVLVLKTFDLSNEDGWEHLTSTFLGGGHTAAAPLRRERAVWSRRIAPPTAKPHVGRNDPCPCGSGKKYKKCCMR